MTAVKAIRPLDPNALSASPEAVSYTHLVTGRPVKWVEDRIENLSTTAFARDFYMETEIACTKDGKVTGLRCYTIADHGAFDACANATKWPAGLFSICLLYTSRCV